jgi:pimeloyl-ACP methyl ester carboxylesterase
VVDSVLPPQALRLQAAARRMETPCGAGRMAWRCWDHGAPVLLLHGGSGSWTHWLRNIQALRDSGRSVVAPDLPGFGESAAPLGGEDADAIIEPLLAGLAEVATGPLDVVGFSFGSLVATLLAERAPERVRRLVLVGAPVLPLSSGKGIAMQPWRHLHGEAQRNAAHAANLRAMMLHRPESVTPEALAVHAANVPRDRMRGRRLVTTDVLATVLARLACPTWMIYGAEDVLYRERWREVIARAGKLAPVRDITLVPEAGHWVQFEDPVAFGVLLHRILADA